MDAKTTPVKPGPRPISDAVWNSILDLKEQGKTAREIIDLTGLSQTKVYEVLRSGTRKENAPRSDTATGLASTPEGA